MTIIVTYESEILGNGEFWRGPPNKLFEIRNVPARKLAEKVASDGVSRKDGMWIVRAVKDK